ncbi:MAG: TetR/AcrR family transcriptional regulator [Mycobacteriales bacterium]
MDGDKQVVDGGRPPSDREPLDTARIVAAAVAFIDKHDLRELTMRRLGAALGVEAMALYRYVPSRDDLLDLVVGSIIDELHVDEDVLDAPDSGWQDYLQRLAHGVRRVALAHPAVFPLVASRPPEAPWLRPPLRSLAWVESFLAAMRSEGFDRKGAVAAYRAFTSFMLGHLLLEVAAMGIDMTPIDDERTSQGDADLSEFPYLAEMREDLADDESLTEFEESLENLLNRIALLQA